jgi:hypothetical protein
VGAVLTHIRTADVHISKGSIEDAILLVVDGGVTTEANCKWLGSPKPQSYI